MSPACFGLATARPVVARDTTLCLGSLRHVPGLAATQRKIGL